ncbi:hypothetical protein, partial [Actinoplanes sp. NPDC026623]|uniref:hypothetical protein n=1 Tax=Actinoplanes sp. NPDC026623 TaxID=3155610 RepID=UPI0033D54F3C
QGGTGRRAGGAGAALPGEADAALSGNTGAICQQAAKTSGDAVRNFALDLKLRIDAESSQDKNLVAKAKEKTSRDVENFAYALKDMSELAADAKLKAALASMSSQVTALKGDVSKVDSARMVKLRATLDKACGDA